MEFMIPKNSNTVKLAGFEVYKIFKKIRMDPAWRKIAEYKPHKMKTYMAFSDNAEVHLGFEDGEEIRLRFKNNSQVSVFDGFIKYDEEELRNKLQFA